MDAAEVVDAQHALLVIPAHRSVHDSAEGVDCGHPQVPPRPRGPRTQGHVSHSTGTLGNMLAVDEAKFLKSRCPSLILHTNRALTSQNFCQDARAVYDAGLVEEVRGKLWARALGQGPSLSLLEYRQHLARLQPLLRARCRRAQESALQAQERRRHAAEIWRSQCASLFLNM